MLTPKPTRDEWNHLLLLLNSMNFPMFSCSHLGKILPGPIRKQCAMSKRVQESNLKEGSAVAKSKLVNLNLSSMRKVPSQEVRDLDSWEYHSLDQHGVSARTWKQSARATNDGRQCILSEETNLQLNPQLETVCEVERSIPPESGSENSKICKHPIPDTWRKSSRTERNR